MKATTKTLNRKGMAASFLAIALMLSLSNCQKENILAEDLGVPEIQANDPGVDVICNAPITYSLMEANGNLLANKCFGAPFAGNPLVPCTGTLPPWGVVDIFKGNNSSYSDPKIYYNVRLAPGWYADVVQSDVKAPGTMPATNGVPIISNDWCTTDINPIANQVASDCEISLSLGFADCYDIGLIVTAVKVNLFSAIIPTSLTTLYTTSDITGGIKYIQDCYGHCPPPTTVITQGTCTNCQAEVTATFNGCHSVSLSSCKPIPKVTIFYTDCSSEVINNPSGELPIPGGNGKVISDIYVRSGCVNPGGAHGQGQPLGMHFSAPCPAGDCN